MHYGDSCRRVNVMKWRLSISECKGNLRRGVLRFSNVYSPVNTLRTKSPHVYERGFSFFSLKRAMRATPDTFTILKRTPGMSPLAWPERPKPATRTSSFSSRKLRQPSRGTKAVIFFPFLISCTRTDLRIAELGCLASIPTFSRTMPFACEEPPKGLHLMAVPKFAFL